MHRITQTRSAAPARSTGGQRGFSLLEMIFATTVLLVGLVGVAQLVPASLLLDQSNRTNSSALIVVQHEMDILVNQPLTNLTYVDPQTNYFYALGDPTQPGRLVGSPVTTVDNRAVIDFSQSLVPGYSLTYTDPVDPTAATWDLRWAVITASSTINGALTPMNKRFIIGARQIGGQGFAFPTTLDTMVSK